MIFRKTASLLLALGAITSTGFSQSDSAEVGPLIKSLYFGDLNPLGETIDRGLSIAVQRDGTPQFAALRLGGGALGAVSTFLGQSLVYFTGQAVVNVPSHTHTGTAAIIPTDGSSWEVNQLKRDFVWGTTTGPVQYYGDISIAQDGQAVVWGGKPLTANGSSTTSRYRDFWAVDAGKESALFLLANWSEGISGPNRRGAVLIESDGDGNLLSETVVLEEGQSVPGIGEELQTVRDIAMSSDGRLAASITTVATHGLWVDGTMVLESGPSSANPATTVGPIHSVSVNKHGQWAAGVQFRSGEYAVFLDGQVIAHGNSSFAPDEVTDLVNVRLTDRGDVYYLATLNSQRRVVAVDETIVFTGGELEVDQGTLFGLDSANLQLANEIVDHRGTQIFLRGLIDTPSTNRDWVGVFGLDLSETVCSGVSSSVGTQPQVGVFRTDMVSSGHSSVYVSELPSNVPAVLLMGHSTQSVPGAGGAIGTLCVGSPIRSQIQTASVEGVLEFNIADELLATGNPEPVTGDQMFFQLWYRDIDPVNNVGVSRLSDAVSITFQ